MTILWMSSPFPGHSMDYANLAPFRLNESNNNNDPPTLRCRIQTNSL